MSIKQRIIEIYASTIARDLVANGIVTDTTEEKVASVVLAAFERNLAEEDEINEEAGRLMRQHAQEISSQSMDTSLLLRRFKSQIAKKRGFSL